MDQNPARLYAGVVGVVLVILGIIGFFYSAAFGSPGDVAALFGIFDVNAWHNLVHIATGVLGLLAFTAGARASRSFALGIGIVYIVVALWGFILGDGESILGFLPVNTADNVFHAAIGLLGVGARAGEADGGAVARVRLGRPGAPSVLGMVDSCRIRSQPLGPAASGIFT